MTDGKGSHILVADDEPGMRDMLSFELTEEGYVVTTAADGAEAIATVEREELDLVICDVRMPKSDGIDVLQFVKRIAPTTEVVIITAYAGLEDAISCLRLGAFDLVQKPFHLTDLLATIERAIEHRRLDRMSRLYESCETMLMKQDVEGLPQHIAQVAMQMFAVEDVAVVLKGTGDTLYVGHSSRAMSSEQTEARLRVCDQVLNDQMPMLRPDRFEDEDAEAGLWPPACSRGARIVYPLQYGERGLGVIDLQRGPDQRKFLRSDFTAVGILASQAALRLENEHIVQGLVRSERMSAMGQIAVGVAHDLNNILTAILSFAGFVKADLPDGDSRREDINEVLKAADRASDLTQKLLAFSRHQAINPKVVDLGDLLVGLGKMVRRILGERTELAMAPSQEIWPIKADPTQVEQILVNLIINAKDAMPDGGTIEIGMDNLTCEEAPSSELPAGDYVRVTVADQGTGMAPDTIAQAFEPFFTTKAAGRGTGLGLSTSFGLIRRMKGDIQIDSTMGKGTRVHLYFPRTHERSVREETPMLEAVLQGHETILVVEDEPSIRRFVVRALKKHGYQALTAQHGEEALRLIEGHADPIHLLLTDVFMPRMGGTELAEHWGMLRPKAPVLFMSGYSDEVVVKQTTDTKAPFGFLAKPFILEDLVRKVREVLDRPSV